MKPEIRIFKSKQFLRSHAVRFLKHEFSQESMTGAPKAMMLSGGATPLAIYNSITNRPSIGAETLRLFLSDERMVPDDSPQSNARMIKPMAAKLKLRAEQTLRVDTSLTAAQAADRFQQDLARELDLGMTIDFGLLGLGSDGHTAGIFSTELATATPPEYAVAVERADGLQGITVTPTLIRLVKKIILIVVGASKKDMLNILLNDPLSIPAGIVLQDHPDVEIWTDQPVKKTTKLPLRK